MNDEADDKLTDPNAAPIAAVDQKQKTDQPRSDKPEPDRIVPEISAFFANPDISPSAFLKALKADEIKRFKKEDEEKAVTAIEDDTSGERLWALLSQANLPAVIDRWIWPVAQERLKSAIGTSFDPKDTNRSHVLRNLCEALAPRLSSKEKSEAKSAENWLRICICWLVEKRSTNPWEIADAVSSILFADIEKSNSLVHRAISKGSGKELRLSVATVKLGNHLIARAKSELTDERHISNNLRVRLTDAEKRIEGLSSELAAAREELIQKEEALKKLNTQLENERHHWGHDLTETKAGQRVLLGERIAPLLSDAIDALEIEPPAPQVALKRIKAALNVIDEVSS